ncbi:MAG TPA: tRNA pseudouridine(55) synthase TruB [Candidatus Babeliales bacterium]|jgi:tRNA pseudouridine55 synthase|nr:tRNA pseudouridine(55) synthase TruB [Candidatus Babeliales bacterium]
MNNIITPGFLLINKPADITSYGCIRHLKRILKQKIKIGHAGTLDPFATGLLIVALGREATRLIDHVMKMKKTYIATGKCGELTDTLDLTGTVVTTCPHIPSEDEIKQSVASFGSSYEQIPPLYSALKHEGARLYSLARHNGMDIEELQKIAESKKRVVQLYDVQLVSYESPYFTIKATVSHGTYIRTLVNDIAVRANSCATTYKLARTVIGHFEVAQATHLTDIATIDDINRLIISVENIDFVD